MRDDYPSTAPNYKGACIVMFGVNITWIFAVIWAVWGLIVVLLTAACINHVMTRLHARALARAEFERAHPRPKMRGDRLPF